MTLLEIKFGYGVKLNDSARDLLAEASVTALTFDSDGQLTPWATAQPIVALETVGKLRSILGNDAEIMIARVVSNSSTASIERLGQRNTTVENTRCHVAVAGLGLLTVNDVQLEPDCCTDRLQELLGEGWRILAVCVQPDQRRPDYILGRTIDEPERTPVRPDRPSPMPTPARFETDIPL